MKYLISFLLIFLCTVSNAQNSFFTSAKNVTLDYNDAPIRTVLEQMLKQSEIKNYVISNDVEGVVTLKLNDYSFESALKIVMRANKVPLLYKIENNILLIERRRETILLDNPKPDVEIATNNNSTWEKIPLIYIDPLDLQVVFGPILNMSQFTRYGTMGFGNFMNGGNMGGNQNNNSNQNNSNSSNNRGNSRNRNR